MRKFGKGKVSVKKMNEKNEKERKWKLSSLYINAVASITTYCVVLWSMLNYVLDDNQVINIVGYLMAIAIIFLMLFMNKLYKKMDEINNKSKFDDILQAFSISGIFGFILEKIFVASPKSIMVIILFIVMLIFPISCIIAITQQKEWRYKQ